MEIPGIYIYISYDIIPGFAFERFHQSERKKKNHDGLSSRVLRGGGGIFYLRNSEPLFE